MCNGMVGRENQESSFNLDLVLLKNPVEGSMRQDFSRLYTLNLVSLPHFATKFSLNDLVIRKYSHSLSSHDASLRLMHN